MACHVSVLKNKFNVLPNIKMQDQVTVPLYNYNQQVFNAEQHIPNNHGNMNNASISKNAINPQNLIKNKKKTRKDVYGKGSEAKAIKKELGDFNANDSPSYKFIVQKYGKSIRFQELLGILNSIQMYAKFKKNQTIPAITRNEKRSFPLLIKYIERNNDLIMPYLQMVSLCDSDFHKIPIDNSID